MVTYLTAVRTPAVGQYTANCQLKKGFPQVAMATATFIGQTNNTFTARINLTGFAECTCAIDCATVSTVAITPPAADPSSPSHADFVKLPVSTICPASEQLGFTARVDLPSSTNPTDFLLTFTDVFGNITEITVSVLKWIVPKAPGVTPTVHTDPPTQFGGPLKADRHSASISIPFQSSDNTDIKASVSAYQIRRYTGHPMNIDLIRGWTLLDPPTNPSNTVWDYLLQDGKSYGYSVRYRGSEGDTTAWSSWTVINT